MIISIDVKKKAVEKIQYLFIIKTLTNLGIERNSLHLIENIYKKHIAHIIFKGKKLEVFTVRSGTT